MAAGMLCAAVESKLGIPAVTGMSGDNPGADLYREKLYIIDSGASPASMAEVLIKMSSLGKKLLENSEIGLPAEEGYLRRGLMRDRFVTRTAAARLVDMVMAKVKGEPFESEMAPARFEPAPLPPPIADLSKSKVMLVTDGGLVPKGNPDRIEGTAATRWGSYRIAGREDLDGADYEISHGGYDPRFVQADPDRLVPLDAARELEREGVIGKLHDEFLSTSGLSNPVSNTRRMGREMAEKAKREGVDAVILTST
jgi:glycine reductase